MVVLASYKDKMGHFMRCDPGLERSFPLRLHLDDYTPYELALICEKVAKQQYGKVFEAGLLERLAKHICTSATTTRATSRRRTAGSRST